jgi:hypothetical protein
VGKIQPPNIFELVMSFIGEEKYTSNEKDLKVSILILTHNAPNYVSETFETLYHITDPEILKHIETIVVDNASGKETKDLLLVLKEKGFIDKLFFSDRNTLFSEGNIIASGLANKKTKYYLLLNSDVSIKNKNWLNYLLSFVESGQYSGVSFGFCYSETKTINGKKFKGANRPDGYCFLIDRSLFDKYQIDYDRYEWWWGLTKFYTQVLSEGKNMLAISHHNKMIVHYGGKSGKDWINAKGIDVDMDEVYKWFDNKEGKVIHKIYDKKQWGLSMSKNLVRLVFYIIIPNKKLREKIKEKYKKIRGSGHFA